MLSYIAKRLAIAVPTLLLLIIISFLLMHAAPGGPFTQEREIPAAVLANLEAKYGLDQPLWKQMGSYVWGVVTEFDFGPSFIYKDRTVNEIIAQGFPVTLTYGSISFALAVIVGVALGVAAAIRHNSWLDYLAVGISIGAQVLPNFVMAPILVLVFTLWLRLVAGRRLAGRSVAVHHHAGDRALDLVHGVHRPDHARLDARDLERQLHPHRPGQGPARCAG